MKTKYTYQEADSTIIFNDGTWCIENGELVMKPDPALAPIVRPLPPCPPVEAIAGYGLKPEDQYWDNLCPKMPYELEQLCADKDLTDEQKVAKLDENPKFYKQEIEYILWHQKAIREGWWMFNKGKPIHLTHDFVFFLTVWKMGGEKPTFRMRDWEWFWAVKSFGDEEPFCIGLNIPKERQIGDTNKASACRLRRASITPYYKTFMQSKDEKHAEFIHDNIVYENWKNLPFYLRPIWDGDVMQKAEIRFFSPNFKGRAGYGKQALKSVIGYRDGSEKGLDGIPQIQLIHNDEIGKSENVDVYIRWQKQRYCLKHGAIKTGFAINTSTVDEMEHSGGKEFKFLCDESHWEAPMKQSKDYVQRDPVSGWTKSGLVNIFIPSNEGFLDYKEVKGKKVYSIDKYGYADLMWTTSYINQEREIAKKGSTEKYLAMLKERPMWWDECFLYNVSHCHFDLAIIRERLTQISFMNPKPYRRGNFYWVDGKKGTKVDWKDDEENGRWILSKLLSNTESNRVVNVQGKMFPDNWMNYVLACDPYKFGKKKGSDGGGCVMRKRDLGMDDNNKDVSLWLTFAPVCTYSFRHHHLDMYAEDMIMTAVYFGCKMSEETNFSYLNQYFEREGYGNFVYKFINNETGIENEQGGQDSQIKQKMEYFRLIDDYISKHGLRCNHPELLEDAMNIQDDFGPYDRLISFAHALKAAKEDEFYFPKMLINQEPDDDLLDFFEGYSLNQNNNIILNQWNS